MASSDTIIDIDKLEDETVVQPITTSNKNEDCCNGTVIPIVRTDFRENVDDHKKLSLPLIGRNMLSIKKKFTRHNEKKHGDIVDMPDPKPLLEIMKEDSLIKSLEDLSNKLHTEKKQQFSKLPTTVIPAESNLGTIDFILHGGNDSSYPPPPYSYYQGEKVHTQQVYMNYESSLQSNFADNFNGSFHSLSVRNNFVAKVYSILTVQLLITFAFVALCVYVIPVKHFVSGNFVLYIIVMVIEVIMMMLLVCCVSIRRKFPINFIVLLIFTAAFAYITGVLASLYSEEAVLYASGTTAGICAFITFIAWMNWFDITTWGFILCIAGVITVVFGIIAAIVLWVTGSDTMFIIYAYIAVVLFTVYLLYDTQQILGGGRVALSPEEYILGALTLYVDIIMIFSYLLMIFGRRR